MTKNIYETILEKYSLDELAAASNNTPSDKTLPKPDGLNRLLLENTLIQLYRGPEYKSGVVAKSGEPVSVECIGTEPINIGHGYSRSADENNRFIEEEVKKQAAKYQANAYALSLTESDAPGNKVLSAVFFRIKSLQESNLSSFIKSLKP